MTNQSLVKWCICLPFLSCTGNLKLQSLLHVTLFLKRNHSPHFLHPVINLLAERSHPEPTIMLGSCTSDSLGFRGWFLVPPLHNMLQLDLKNDLYWQVKESKAREIVQLAKPLKHEGLGLTTRNYVNQAGACWNAPEILVLGRRKEEKATTWDVDA